MKRSGVAASVAVACSLGLCGAAQAATLTAEFSGAITAGIDKGGAFGAAGADLTGAAFSAVVTFDSAVGAFLPLDGGYGLYGGFATGTPSSGVASLTIAGASVNFATSSSYIASIFHSYHPLFAIYLIGGANSLSMQVYDSPFIGPLNGNFSLTCGDCYGSVNLKGAGILFAITEVSYSVSDPSALPGPEAYVPEPSTWAMMILGFGATGASLRRRARVNSRIAI